MTRIFIAYATTEGQTAKIADFIADVVRTHGHEADTWEIKGSRGTIPGDCDGVIVGASVHMGKHDKHAVNFVQENRDALERLPSAFFSVSLAAHGDNEEAAAYVERFEQETGWLPARLALFGGALRYTHYGLVKGHMMRRIARSKPGNLGTDTSRDYVYTEWDGVQRFAEDFLADVTAEPGKRRT
jgi:menaquinone-dependent protoporphyrinogen oxidase